MNDLILKSSRSEQPKSQPPETGNAETSLESLLVLTEDSFQIERLVDTQIQFHLLSNFKHDDKFSLSPAPTKRKSKLIRNNLQQKVVTMKLEKQLNLEKQRSITIDSIASPTTSEASTTQEQKQ